ncbi:MAG: RsmB/NOP family class I SAM-dependent RNA methyltransferase [Longimicrobiales bacterium]|nr:RsmB/NOP family class I SAM-dependent RNA methyltransferase [Longimicrobiales bacterium]
MSLERYRSIIPDWPAFQEASERPEPQVFRVRTGRISPDALRERLEAQGYRLRPLEGMPAFFQVEDGPRPVSFSLEHWLGLLYVQQASTGVAAPALAPLPGERVLDLCAAPGGKTTHAADLMGDRGVLVAAEVNENRIRGLLGNTYRLGHPNILVIAGDGRDFPEEAPFDRVLVDAPCSGEGTLRRRAGRPPNRSRRFLGYVAKMQDALLRKAIRVTRPGGTILYVTCTFAPEENEALVSRVLQDAPVELEPLELPVPHAPGLTGFEGKSFDPRLEGAARIYPHHLDSGGLFLARLRRLDDGTSPPEGAWAPVPGVFPGDGMETAEAERLVALGLESVHGHLRVDPEVLRGMSWMARGGRLWLHGLPAWPLAGWSPGGWRVVSLGLRAMEFDTLGRPRPTNDLFQWLGSAVRSGGVDLADDELLALCEGRAVPREERLGGLLALRYRGMVVGRGVITREGIRSEISRPLAADLKGIVEGRGPVSRPPTDE